MTRALGDLHKQRIGTTLVLRKGVSLSRVMAQLETATQQFRHDMDAESAARHKDAEVVNGILTISFNRYTSKGAPLKAALRAYIRSLVGIYEPATGKRIGRNVDAYARGHSEKPHPFLLACLKAADALGGRGTRGYPRGIIRDVLRSLR